MKDMFLKELKDNKQRLREEFRRRRDAFVGQLDIATRNLAFRRPPSPLAKLIDQCEVIALYQAMDSEAPTSRLIEYLVEMGKTTALPTVTGNEPLEFRIVSNVDILETGYKNIPEPPKDCAHAIPDIIIAPMIAFDRSLNRLGQGGGHYDRTFEKYPEAVRIGLAWSVQETEQLPVEAHDIALQMIVTECEIIQ